jgi:UDP-N-acetylmuramyl pentapeptide phosphotransferase/UDP-N-acetylglucosamine-1-phosphate transferase
MYYFIILALSAGVTFVLIALSRPILRQYALARPNPRSSHTLPTPQGGGIFVIATTIAVAASVYYLESTPNSASTELPWVLLSTVLLTVVGAVDDLCVVGAVPRLVFQTVAAAIVILSLPEDTRVFPMIPREIEWAILLLGGIWFVNLVNFMDGIDWMTVAEVLPVTAGLAIFGYMGVLPHEPVVVAVALCGAMIGFAPFNRPVARLFLGDVGSLPIGLLLGWLLVLLAGSGRIVPAILLPLYYLADATITLMIRIGKGESPMKAHRSHFYQRALDNGLTVNQVVGRVFAANILLLALATIAVANSLVTVQVTSLAVGIVIVGCLFWIFARTRTQ